MVDQDDVLNLMRQQLSPGGGFVFASIEPRSAAKAGQPVDGSFTSLGGGDALLVVLAHREGLLTTAERLLNDENRNRAGVQTVVRCLSIAAELLGKGLVAADWMEKVPTLIEDPEA